MLRCDLRCLLTSSVKELRLAPQCRAPLSFHWSFERCHYWQAARSCSRGAQNPAASGDGIDSKPRKHGGHFAAKPGKCGTLDVRFPVPKYYQQYATQECNPVPTTGRLLL